MKHSQLKRLLALAVAFVMTLNMGAMNVSAAESEKAEADRPALTYEKLDSGAVSAQLKNTDNEIQENETLPLYADTDNVRVMIVLEDAPAVYMMEDGMEASDESIAEYREELREYHDMVAETISEEVLDGEPLDVIWNLTLAVNAMSANVEYGKIDEISNMEGIKFVYVETRYMPLNEAGTMNIVAQEMTGAGAVKQESGYYGAGSRVAVIDTGTDTDHQSFDEEAYLYALKMDAARKGVEFDSYVKSLNLMTEETIAGVLDQLNCKDFYAVTGEELSAEDLYLNAKLPFAFNYVDVDLDVTHDNDIEGDHGSHVAGIATANTYIASDIVYDFDGDEDFDEDDAQALMDHIILGSEISHEELADVSYDGAVTAYDVWLLLTYLDGGVYVSAADTVGVTGVASDAQLITMKVFGKNGGTWASDYMAAAEDAMVLGCDVANLSLGSPYPGFIYHHGEYVSETEFINQFMKDIQKSGTVMCVAAGNSGNWADMDDGFGLMYPEEGGTYNTSDPSTYAGAFSVASADNAGSVNESSTVFSGEAGEVSIVPEELAGGVNEMWKTLDETREGTEYDVVFLGDPSAMFAGEEQTDMSIYAGSADDFADYDYTGKIVLVSRGNEVYFSQKHINAAAAGAAGVLIYNNEPGLLSATIQGSDATVPCGGLTLDEAKAIYELASVDENGTASLKVTITQKMYVISGEDAEYYTMSSFSSWGPSGALNLKPEITAPGGSIYSVNGDQAATDGYKLMSGTSMASPHAAGLTALAAQYIRENEVLAAAKKACGAEDMTARNLAQSLLMSTAEPMIEEESGLPYSLRNQGAGLAAIEKAAAAESFILVEGQDDGKVKAELGDGVDGWSFSFSVNNLTDAETVYDLDAEFMTTDTVQGEYAGNVYNLTADQMTELGAEVVYLVDGIKADKVTVPANGSVTVNVTVEVNESSVKAMEALGYVNGFYVEGFLYVTSENGATEHSIPVLGWYGNWTDISMFDSGSYIESVYGTASHPSHINSYVKNVLAWSPVGYGEGIPYSGNIYGGFNGSEMLGDQRYLEKRNAFNNENSKWEIFALFPTVIRAAAAFKMQVTDVNTGELYFEDNWDGWDTALLPCFYYPEAGQWIDVTTEYGLDFGDWNFTDMEGNLLPEGTEVKLSMICAPEYYLNEDGTMRWDEVGHGADLSFCFKIDNTCPDLADVENPFELEWDENGKASALNFAVRDNNYIASVILLNGSGTEAAEYFYPDMDLDQMGEAISGSFDISEFTEKYGSKAVIAICDYAGNETYYGVNLNGDGTPYGEFVGFEFDYEGTSNKWVSFDKDVSFNETEIYISETEFACAEYVNGYIFAETIDGSLYAFRYDDMLKGNVDLERNFITRLERVYQDMAFNYADGMLYGLNTIEDKWGTTTEVCSITLTPDEWSGEYYEEWVLGRDDMAGLALAIDDEGSIYVLAVETDEETGEDTTAHLWKASSEEQWWGEVSYGGLQYVGDTGMTMDYRQAMTWNHNDEKLYWARCYPKSFYDIRAELVEINPETAEAEKLGEMKAETACLCAPLTEEAADAPEHAKVPDLDADIIGTPVLSPSNLMLGVGQSKAPQLSFDPWYTGHKDVIWTSGNEEVAVVDENGMITGISDGNCTVTVTSRDDESLSAVCEVTVASLSLEIDGMLTYSSGGLGTAGGSQFYSYKMEDGEASMTTSPLKVPSEFNYFGTSIASSVMGRGSLWACEYGNTGMIYEIDDETDTVTDILGPVDGDMMFGMAYSDELDSFTGIMNYFMYVDQPFTKEANDEMLDSYDKEQHAFTWHRFDMAEYVNASQGNLVTPEEGDTSIVFTGITNIGKQEHQSVYQDYLGNYSMMGDYAEYDPDTTWVLMDNVGRMWYIDEVTNLKYDGYCYYSDDESTMITAGFNGVIPLEYAAAPEAVNAAEHGADIFGVSGGDVSGGDVSGGDVSGSDAAVTGNDAAVYSAAAMAEAESTYSVFVIRKMQPTVMHDMFLNGEWSSTYTFSDLHYVEGENGEEMYFISTYDYWNEGDTSNLYLFIPGEKEMGWDGTWYTDTPDVLYELGTTGKGFMLATIHSAKINGGLPAADSEENVFMRLYNEEVKAPVAYKGKFVK